HIIYVSPLYAETNNQTNPMDIKIANNSNKSSTPETTSYPEFDLSLLNNKNIDYSYLNIKGNDIISGDYLVDLIVNVTYIQLLNITFKINETKDVKACIPIEMLYIAGIKEEYLKPYAEQECASIEKVLPGSSENFRLGELRLELTIPTIMIN